MLITSTNLRNARLMDFFQVMSLTNGFLQKEDLTALHLADVAGEFNTAFAKLDKALYQAQKTGYTDDIIAADDKRDNILIGFLATLHNLVRFPDSNTVAAATQLLVKADKYGQGIARLPQREETAAITNMVSDLRDADTAPLLQTAGLTAWVDKLDEANIAFNELYKSRTEKEAEFITGLTRTERANMQSAFEKLTEAINAYSFINGTAAYKALADKINTEVANMQQAAKARATLAAHEAEKKKSEEQKK